MLDASTGESVSMASQFGKCVPAPPRPSRRRNSTGLSTCNCAPLSRSSTTKLPVPRQAQRVHLQIRPAVCSLHRINVHDDQNYVALIRRRFRVANQVWDYRCIVKDADARFRLQCRDSRAGSDSASSASGATEIGSCFCRAAGSDTSRCRDTPRFRSFPSRGFAAALSAQLICRPVDAAIRAQRRRQNQPLHKRRAPAYRSFS